MGAAVYRWNAALNQWTECHAVCRYSVANESRFSSALLSQVAIVLHPRGPVLVQRIGRF
jgi:hypothetical protein